MRNKSITLQTEPNHSTAAVGGGWGVNHCPVEGDHGLDGLIHGRELEVRHEPPEHVPCGIAGTWLRYVPPPSYQRIQRTTEAVKKSWLIPTLIDHRIKWRSLEGRGVLGLMNGCWLEKAVGWSPSSKPPPVHRIIVDWCPGSGKRLLADHLSASGLTPSPIPPPPQSRGPSALKHAVGAP